MLKKQFYVQFLVLVGFAASDCAMAQPNDNQWGLDGTNKLLQEGSHSGTGANDLPRDWSSNDGYAASSSMDFPLDGTMTLFQQNAGESDTAPPKGYLLFNNGELVDGTMKVVQSFSLSDPDEDEGDQPLDATMKLLQEGSGADTSSPLKGYLLSNGEPAVGTTKVVQSFSISSSSEDDESEKIDGTLKLLSEGKTTFDAPTPRKSHVSVLKKADSGAGEEAKCKSAGSSGCQSCLQNGCVWAGGSCIPDCSTVADTACYGPHIFRNLDLQEICELYETIEADHIICSTKTSCGLCTSTLKSDGQSPCLWFSDDEGSQGWCGAGRCEHNGICGTDTCADTKDKSVTKSFLKMFLP